MEKEETVKHKFLIEKNVFKVTWQSVLIALIVALILGVGLYFLMYYLEIPPVESGIIVLAGILIYAVFLFIAIRNTKEQEIKEVETPIKKVYISNPVQTVERPVVRNVIRTVEKPIIRRIPVYIEKARKKLNIPKYNFVGSDETKTYHKRSCRLGKLIKRKNKVSNNSEDFFKKRKYKPCKICLKTKVKKSSKKVKRQIKKKIIQKKDKKKSPLKKGAGYSIGGIR